MYVDGFPGRLGVLAEGEGVWQPTLQKGVIDFDGPLPFSGRQARRAASTLITTGAADQQLLPLGDQNEDFVRLIFSWMSAMPTAPASL